MPFVNIKKAAQSGGSGGSGKCFLVRITTMDAELEFNIDVRIQNYETGPRMES